LPAARWRLEFRGGPLYLLGVGKTYLFECPLCQYRVKISGGADRGLHCEIQTVICRDCRELYDVFIRQRRRADAVDLVKFPGFYRPEIPPTILREGSVSPSGKPPVPLVWRTTAIACPVEPQHSVEAWNDPARCPRCGNYMEKNGFPYRTWD
jgi:hypothetical protein